MHSTGFHTRCRIPDRNSLQAKRRKRRAAYHLCRYESLTVTQMLIVHDNLRLDIVKVTVQLKGFLASPLGTVAFRIPQGQRNALLTTELALGTIDRNPAHHWHYAVVPSPRHSVSWSLPSPYLCSRRTVPKMCFCSCFLLIFKFRLQNYYLFLVLSLCKI